MSPSPQPIAVAAPPDTLNIDEAAAVMRIGVDAMRELVVRGDIPALSLNRKHCVILRADLLAYVATMARKQQAEKKGRVVALTPAPSVPVTRRRAGRRRNPLPSF